MRVVYDWRQFGRILLVYLNYECEIVTAVKFYTRAAFSSWQKRITSTYFNFIVSNERKVVLRTRLVVCYFKKENDEGFFFIQILISKLNDIFFSC